MKRILSILLLTCCATAYASVDYYEGNGLFFPDETSSKGLPEAIPCTMKKIYTGQTILNCTWLANARHVLIWDAQRQQDMKYVNQISGMCQRGKCRVSNAMVGEWNQDIPFLISIWYRIGSSTDGKPVAYRNDVSREVSYAEAGNLLMQLYMDAGIPDNELASTFDKRYEGGYAAWQAQKGGNPTTASQSSATSAQSEWPEVKSAWCNPRMDDECYINNQRVAVADLGKWLPAVAESNIDQIGGYCETILCFDKDNLPAGYLLQ